MPGARRTRARHLLAADLAGAGQCPACGHTDTFLAPACDDGHGTECPDRLCVDCDSALVVGPLLPALAQSA